jgi:hypothetical protein
MCRQTEIVCHWSLLMSLELAEQSIQLLTCHISRLFHCSQQENQSKSWKKCDLCFFLSLITSHADSTTQGRTYNFLYVIISRRRLCHRSLQDNQSKSREKVWPLVLLSLGMVSMTPGNSFLLVYIRLGISFKAKKEWKLFLSVRPPIALAGFFLFGVMPPN